VNYTEVHSRGILVWRTYTQGVVLWPQRSGLGFAVSRFPPSEKLRSLTPINSKDDERPSFTVVKA
jgi:hypothetical protein